MNIDVRINELENLEVKADFITIEFFYSGGFSVYNDRNGESFVLPSDARAALMASTSHNDVRKIIRMFAIDTPELNVSDEKVSYNSWYELTRKINATLNITDYESLAEAIKLIPDNISQLIADSKVL